jgi:hypothetical protein
MKSFAPLLVCAACLAGTPATAGTLAAPDNPIVFAGSKFCVGPACVGRDRDRDRYRHGREWRGRDRDVEIYRHRRDRDYDRD